MVSGPAVESSATYYSLVVTAFLRSVLGALVGSGGEVDDIYPPYTEIVHVPLQLIESLWCEVKPEKTECTFHQVKMCI